MNIAVVGTGYVGLVAGTCFADLGNNVVCIDNNNEKIDLLNKGGVPIYEPGLKGLIEKNVKAGRLKFSTDLKKSIQKSKVVFIAVGTPSKKDGSADLKYVEMVAEEIGKAMNDEKIIVNKSTVPVGTGNLVENIVKKHYSEKFHVVSNPEFLREGNAIKDFLEPDRVVIGNADKKAAETMEQLYKPLNCEILFTDVKSAELIKYASNTFLATKISFINEVANFCDKVGADVSMVAKGMGLDERIGEHFLNAGAGYGGSCFPKDVKELISVGKRQNYNFKIAEAVENVNMEQKKVLIKKAKKMLGSLKGKTIGLLGLAFKPNTDDMREAPALVIIKELIEQGAKVKAFDPIAMKNTEKLVKKIEFAENAYDAIKDCDALMLVTEWNDFKEIDFKRVKTLLKQPIIIDGRNIYSREKLEKMGFKYTGIGK